MSKSPNNKPYLYKSSTITNIPTYLTPNRSTQQRQRQRQRQSTPSRYANRTAASPLGVKQNLSRDGLSLDQDSVRLVEKIVGYREKLQRRLHGHTMVFQLEQFSKCSKHGFYFSVYDKQEHELLCAQCYTNRNKPFKPPTPQHHPSTPKQQPLKPKHPPQSPNTHSKSSLIPIEKARLNLQNDLILKRLEIDTEISTIKQIESILYAGFERERKAIEEWVERIDRCYGDVMGQLERSRESAKGAVEGLFAEELGKHEIVIKELGLLRKLIEDYSQNIDKTIQNVQFYDKKIVPKKSLLYEQSKLQQLKNKAKYAKNVSATTIYLQQLRLLRQKQQQNDQRIRSSRYETRIKDKDKDKDKNQSMSQFDPQVLKFIIYKHTVYTELTKNLKFGKNENIWSSQKHKNRIKQKSQAIINSMQKIKQSIPQYKKNKL